LVNNLLTINDTLLGVNPVDVLNRFGTANGTNATSYIYYTIPANLNGNSVLALQNQGPMRRFLQAVLSIFNLNTNSPIATIPMNFTAARVNGTGVLSYSLAAIRDPKPLLRSLNNYIHSQVVGERAFINGNPKTGVNFTNTTNNTINSNATNNNTNNSTALIQIQLPWAHIPFNLSSGSNYLNNCQVFRWNGGDFVPTNSCVLVNTTDQNKAVLNCNHLDIIGVGCKNNSNTILVTGGNGNGNGVGSNNNSSSGRIKLASLIAVLLLFVF